MMNARKTNTLMTEHQTADEQLARDAIGLLNSHTQGLDALTAQRLSKARELAVSRLASRQTQTTQQSGHVLQWFGDGIEQHRIMLFAVIAGMLLMAFVIAQQSKTNNVEDSDAFLLASELPPEAYADKGFDAWLGEK